MMKKKIITKTGKTNSHRLSTKERLMHLGGKAQHIIGAHAVTIIIAMGGITIGYCLYQSRSYLNPQRDEERYSEGVAKNNYSKIDQKVLGRLKQSQNNKDSQINADLAPNRLNPFSE